VGFARMRVGDLVVGPEGEALIARVIGAEQVIVRHLTTGSVREVRVQDIKPSALVSQPNKVDLSVVPNEVWEIAEARYEAIKPLLQGDLIDKTLLNDLAEKAGRHPATIYRWLRRYRQENEQTALIPAKRGVEAGRGRLKPEVEAILIAAIRDRYLKQSRVTPAKLHKDVARMCRAAGFPSPHENTVRNRVKRLLQRTVVEARVSKRAAREQFEPIKGHFPPFAGPLAVVQIDHSKVDVIVVDEVDRKPLARPWLSVAIDVFSRVVVGFYLSLEAPSAASTGMCVANAILPKDTFLSKWEIATPWPVWGKMSAIHCDNGKDFRGAMLRQACQQYGIELLFRPVRQPHYGGHIERLMGTFAREIHTLPGTTFSNPSDRKDYDSEKRSALTLRELEGWLARFIVEIYHQRPHSGLGGRPPLLVYEEAIAQNGLPELCTNESRLRLDFMPAEHRAVTVNGIVLDHISYFHDLLRPWVNAKQKNGCKRLFAIRRDLRDISVVYFFDPELQEHFAIPYRDRSHPAISLWEVREIRRRLKEQGRNSTNEDVLFRGYAEMRQIEDAAVNKTKQMRRNRERRNARELLAIAAAEKPPSGSLWDEKLRPFEEVIVPEWIR
jgi:putative transposase